MPTFEPAIITPQTAMELLEKRPDHQRVLSKTTVKQYAELMRMGVWRSTHQPIALDTDGAVLDGQHRLAAIVSAGVPIEVIIARDCDPSTFSVIDVGLGRTASQFISGLHRTAIAEAARLLLREVEVVDQKNNLFVWKPRNTGRTAIDPVLGVVEDWPELIEFAVSADQVYRATKISKSAHLAVLAQAARGEFPDRLASWLEGLLLGAELEATDPRLQLRNRWMQQGPLLNAGGRADTRLYLITRAWNAHARGEKIEKLQSPRVSNRHLPVA